LLKFRKAASKADTRGHLLLAALRPPPGACYRPSAAGRLSSAPALVDVQVHWTCCGSYA